MSVVAQSKSIPLPASQVSAGGVARCLFVAFLFLSLITPSWRSGPFAWWPLWPLATRDGASGELGLLTLLPLGLLGAWLLARWHAPTRRWEWGARAVTLPLLLLSGLLLLGLDPGWTWSVAVQGANLALLWLVYLFVINERPPLALPLALVLLCQGSVAVGQFLAQQDLGLSLLGELPLDPTVVDTSVLWARGQPWLRGYGLTAHPNALGALLATLLLLLLPALVEARAWRRTWLATGMAVGLLGLLVTFSRAAGLAFALGLALWLFQQRRRFRLSAVLNTRLVPWLILGVMAGLLFLLPFRDLAESRWVNLDTPIEARSVNDRLRDLSLAIQIIQAHPLRGVGVDHYLASAKHLHPDALTVHNALLLVTAELGIGGLIAWLWLTGVGFGLAPDRGQDALAFAPSVAFFVIGLFDITLWPTTGLRVAMLFGLLAAFLSEHLQGGTAQRAPRGGVRERLQTKVRRPRPTLRWLAWGALLLLAMTLPLEPVRPLLSLGRLLAFSTLEVTLLAAVALWALSCLAARRVPDFPRPFGWLIALWLGVLLLAALLAPAFQLEALKFWSRVLNGVLAGWMCYDLSASPDRWRRVAQAMALAGIIVGLFGLAEASGSATLLAFLAHFKQQVTRVGDLNRVSATLTYPTIAAMFLEMTLPLLLVWLWTTPRRWLRLLLGLGLLAGMTTLVLTLSRAGVVGLLGGFGLMAAVAWWYRHTPGARGLLAATLGAAAGLIVLTGVAFAANPLVKLRLLSETEQQWYQASYLSAPLPTLRPGQTVRVPVQLRNASVRDWKAGGAERFALSYHLLREDGETFNYEGPRTFLEEDVAPGDTVEVQAMLRAPEQPGRYWVEWDMVQEDVTWFSWKETPTLREPLTVVGEVAAAPAPEPEPAADTPPRLLRIPTPTRGTLWRAAAKMLLAHPLLGIGPGTFRHAYGGYLGMELWDDNIHSNNLYIEWLAGSGLLGFGLFLGISGSLLRHAWRALRPAGALWPWRLAIVAALLAWFLHGLLDYFFEFTPTYIAFWLLVGLLWRAPIAEQAGP